MNEISCVLPNLYLSGKCFADDKAIHDKYNIRSIINVDDRCVNFFENDNEYTYFVIKEIDSPSTDLKKYFQSSTEFIQREISLGKSVLVHCGAGVSRSATIVLAYLMGVEKMSLDDALEFLQDKRSVVQPNIGFHIQLMEFEKELNNK